MRALPLCNPPFNSRGVPPPYICQLKNRWVTIVLFANTFSFKLKPERYIDYNFDIENSKDDHSY